MTTHTLNFFESNDLLTFIERDDLRFIRKFLREQQRQDRNVDTLLAVDRGALYLNIRNREAGYQEEIVSATLLYYSCFFTAVKIVEFLVSEGKANVNIRSVMDADINAVGIAPIGAISKSDTLTQNECTIIRFLLDNGANPKDALYLAIKDQNLDLIRMLFDKGANNNFPPFYQACIRGHVNVIKLLLESGANKGINGRFVLGHFKSLESRSVDQLQNMDNRVVGSDLDTNTKKAIVDVLTFYCSPLTVPAEWQAETIQQRKRKREQSKTTANERVLAATTTAATIETSARINEELNSHQRLMALKMCHMMSKLPIRDLRFEVLGYLAISDVEQIFE